MSMRIGTTKLSSKSQVVIPAEVKRAAGFSEGETLLAVAVGDSVLLKRVSSESFAETVRPIWRHVRKLGLTQEYVDTLIEEARSKSRS
jgi:AbrB family looped-hinge helix DNA binding protein